MGPEESAEKVKLYMMVDGQPVEIVPEIAEVKLPEDQQSGDVLPFQECEITVDAHIDVPMIHGRMIYRCEHCGKSWPMYLEKGIEEFGENHKPSPFTITCPYCGGWAMDVSGILKVPGGGYVPLPEGGHYFTNMEGKDCGVPVFCAERLQESNETQAAIADALERLKSREMEMCREAMREEWERMEKIANAAMPDEAEEITKTSVIVAKKAGVTLEEAVGMVLKAIQDFGDGLKAAFAPFLGELDLTAIEPGEPLDVPTAWDRKEAREKQRAMEQATAARFRQYKARESAWAAQKRAGRRRREWRGPWKEN